MIKAERHDRILAELARRGAISVGELAGLLGASSATVRRDIAELDAGQAVLRTHGGVTLRGGQEEPSYDSKVMAFLPEKRRIGAMAASMLSANMTVGCGGGTTVMQTVAAIKRMRLHVVTTAINVALELRDAPEVDVLLTGGMLRARTVEMVGHVAERTLRDVNLDVAMIGVDGIDPKAGLSTYDSAEAYVNRVLIERAREVWILADHSKFGQVRPAIIAECRAATVLITDAGLDETAAKSLQKCGIRILRT